MISFDEIVKKSCPACGIYLCKIHLDWEKCVRPGCISTWDAKVFWDCPMCLKNEGKDIYKPQLKDTCCLCKEAIPTGTEAFTDTTPGGTFCGLCAHYHKIAFWTIKVEAGKLWNQKDIIAQRRKVGA